MIIKVQVSLFTTEAKQQVFMYNQSRDLEWQCDATPELLALMAGEPKKFFNAHWTKVRGFRIIDEAPWQDW